MCTEVVKSKESKKVMIITSGNTDYSGMNERREDGRFGVTGNKRLL